MKKKAKQKPEYHAVLVVHDLHIMPKVTKRRLGAWLRKKADEFEVLDTWNYATLFRARLEK